MNKDKSKVLFIADKWCAGKKSFGLSEWETNLWQSIKSLGMADVEVFHFDDYYEEHKKTGDEEVLKKISVFKPDLICLIIYNIPGSAVNLPTWSTIDKIRDGFKIPMIAIWGDLEITEQVDISRMLLPYVLFNVATASSAAVERIDNPKKYFYMWVPKDPKVFNDPKKERDIAVSYVGSPKPDRLRRINYLKRHGIQVTHGGGERQEHKTTEQYAETYQRSKITLSFSRAHLSHVINARPFEAMNCGAMLLEQESFEFPKLYIPFVDYVPYRNNMDMLRQVRYYLDHEDERRTIAENGWKKTTSLYSAESFWKKILDKAFSETGGDSPMFEYAHIDSFKLRFLDRMCSSPATFRIYTLFRYQFYKDAFLRLSTGTRNLMKKTLPDSLFGSILRIKRKIWTTK